MRFGAYRDIFAIRPVRTVMLLGTLSRITQFGVNIMFTLFLVDSLGYSYSRAGLITAILTIGMAVSAPWRGAMLDRRGLRSTMIPSILVQGLFFSALLVVPNNFWLISAMALASGLMMFPSFSVIRQAVIGSTPMELRRAAISLDSTIVEICFMIGPAIGVALATSWDARYALVVFGLLTTISAGILTWYNPSIIDAHADPAEQHPTGSRFSWVTPQVAAILAALGVAGFILAATDLGVVAALRDMDKQPLIGVTLAVWGLGSAIAGLAYGALSRPIPVLTLVLGLGVTTGVVAFAQDVISLNVLLLIAGVFCAPTLVAGVDQLQQAVPAGRRGQALGWQGSFMTAGNTLAPPLVGFAIDSRGWHAGFILAGGLGLLAGLALLAVTVGRRKLRRSPAPR